MNVKETPDGFHKEKSQGCREVFAARGTSPFRHSQRSLMPLLLQNCARVFLGENVLGAVLW